MSLTAFFVDSSYDAVGPPISMSGDLLPELPPCHVAKWRNEFELLLPGWAFETRSKYPPSFMVCVPQTLVTLSWTAICHFFANRMGSKPPGLKIIGPPPPQPLGSTEGIWSLLSPKTPWYG